MAQDDKPDSMDNKVDALAAMAGGQDISHEGFNAVEAPVDEPSAATADLVAQTPETPEAPEPVSPVSAVPRPAAGTRRKRSGSMKKQRARAQSEQFKRMMVPILLVTGVILLALGGLVAYLMSQGAGDAYTGSGAMDDPGMKRIMVFAAFPLGAIMLIGAWFFHMDIKRSDAAARREEENGDG